MPFSLILQHDKYKHSTGTALHSRMLAIDTAKHLRYAVVPEIRGAYDERPKAYRSSNRP